MQKSGMSRQVQTSLQAPSHTHTASAAAAATMRLWQAGQLVRDVRLPATVLELAQAGQERDLAQVHLELEQLPVCPARAVRVPGVGRGRPLRAEQRSTPASVMLALGGRHSSTWELWAPGQWIKLLLPDKGSAAAHEGQRACRAG